MRKLRDEEIAGGVVSALARDGRVNSADRVQVAVDRGTVTLSGIVRSAGEKAAAGEAAAGVPGVALVQNEITVAMDGTIPDDELAEAVGAALERTAGVSLHEVGVEVDDGIVTLVGHVPDVAYEEATTRAAGSVKGVKSVVSALAFDEQVDVTGLPIDDTTLRNLAMGALSDADLDLPALEVHAAEGVVYLDGLAGSAADRRRATEIVQHLTGAKRVVNRLVLARSEFSREPDQRLIAQVLRALHNDRRINPQYLRVTADNGVVRLAGQVDSIEQQNAAVAAARSVPGVREVISEVLLMDRTSKPSDDKGRPRADIGEWLHEKERWE